MRILIESDIETIDALRAELSSQADASVETAQPSQDLAEQKFGFAEVSALIAIVKGVNELAPALLRLAKKIFKRTPEAKPQTLRLRSAIGVVTVDIAPGTTLEQLERALAPLTEVV